MSVLLLLQLLYMYMYIEVHMYMPSICKHPFVSEVIHVNLAYLGPLLNTVSAWVLGTCTYIASLIVLTIAVVPQPG